MTPPFSPLLLVWAIPAYLLGSLPVGLLLARIKGRDPRRVGSGNIGATNVMRTAGKAIGLFTLLGDALKGFLPVWLGIWAGLPSEIVAALGFAAFLGHLFPLYLKFKGGKGVATSLGIFLALNYVAVLVDLVVFVGVIFGWRYVSLGSMVCAVLMPFILAGLGAPGPFVILAGAIAIFTCMRHKANLTRLLSGKESKIGRSRST